MTEQEWRFSHGVGPEPHTWEPLTPDPAPVRDRTWVIPDEDLVFVTDTTKTGLDTWDI